MQSDGAEALPLGPEAPYELGGEVLCVRRAAAVSGDEETPATQEHAREQPAPPLCVLHLGLESPKGSGERIEIRTAHTASRVRTRPSTAASTSSMGIPSMQSSRRPRYSPPRLRKPQPW